MGNLLKEYEEWVKQAEAREVNLIEFNSPCCNKKIKAMTPKEEGALWDSLSQCPYCAELFYKYAYFDHIETKKVDHPPEASNA